MAVLLFIEQYPWSSVDYLMGFEVKCSEQLHFKWSNVLQQLLGCMASVDL